MTEENMLKFVGNNIKQFRLEKRVLQQDLAAMCNMEVPNISRIENGRTNPTLKTLYKICLALDISLEELLRLPDDK